MVSNLWNYFLLTEVCSIKCQKKFLILGYAESHSMRCTERIINNACILNCGFNQVNQIGTVTESIEAVKMAKQADWGVMTSHRRSATIFNLLSLHTV
jgi:hypothetical protein